MYTRQDDDDDLEHDNQEYSATSDPANTSVQTKDVIEEGNSVNISKKNDLCSCSAELALIRKQLLDIEHRQTSLMDLIQIFTRKSMDGLSDLKSKVNNLESTVDKIAQNFPMTRSWVNGPKVNSVNSCGQRVERTQVRKPSGGMSEGRSAVWKRIKEMVRAGDLEAAYEEAIGFGDEVVLAELMDGTGPVLEVLSSETMAGVLLALSVFVRDRRFLHLAVPWLQQACLFISPPIYLSAFHTKFEVFLIMASQMVEMGGGGESGTLHLWRKEKKQLLAALQEAAAIDSGERSSLEEIYSRLRRAWCDGATSRRLLTTYQ